MDRPQSDSGCVTVVALLVMAAVLALMAVLTGMDMEKKRFQREAVKVGAAEYNSTTGLWQWKAKASEDHPDSGSTSRPRSE